MIITLGASNMQRTLYTIFFYLALPAMSARLKWRTLRQPDYNQGWLERLGGRSTASAEPIARSLWVQATSVGEMQAATPLIKALQDLYPTLPIVVTNITPTGLKTAKQLLGGSVIHHYFPLDIPYVINRFMKRFNPILVVLMETDMWPNVLHSCGKRQIPILLANARLSTHSAKGYRYIKSFTQKALNNITVIAAQTPADAKRFIALGADPEKVFVAGNLKCNVSLPDDLLSQGSSLKTQLIGKSKKHVFTLASLHYNEATTALEALAALKKTSPDTLFLLVPRKPEEFDALARLCVKRGFSLARYSETKPADYSQDTDIFMVDTLGKLLLFYSASDVVFVAGSLKPSIGGHSLIEPALLAKPIITGCYIKNWVGIADILREAQALHQVNNANALAQTAAQLLQSPEQSQQLGHRTKDIIHQHTQALQKHIDKIIELVKKS